MKIILLFLFFINSYASEQLSILPRLKMGEGQLSISTGFYVEEKTYEKDALVIDLANQEGYVQTLSYKKGFSDFFVYEVEIKALLNGRYNESYSGDLSFIEDMDRDSYGVREPVFKLYYWLENSIPNFEHVLLTSYRPKLVEPKSHHFYSGRNEFTLSYLYKYHKENVEISGELFSTIFGKKEIRLDSGAEDIIESFTEVGIKFNPGIIFDKFSIHLLSSYSSMTDYNTKNKYFDRYSDKGYAVEIGGRLNWIMSKTHGLSISYLERESYFNSIEEDLSRNIEYEIDSEEFMLSLWILL